MSIDSWNWKRKNIGHRKLPRTNLRLLRDYETGFCSPLALRVLEKKILKDLAIFFVFEIKVKV
jgi:hypothetical protein